MQQLARGELRIDDKEIVQFFGKRAFTVNIRAYLIADACKRLTSFVEKLSELISDIGKKISESHELIDDISQHQLFSTDLKELPVLTRSLHECVRQAINPLAFIHQLHERLAIDEQVLSLKEIGEQLDTLRGHLSIVKRELDDLYRPILNVRNKENSFLEILGDIEQKLNILLLFFDEITELSELKELIATFKEIKDRYENDLPINIKRKIKHYKTPTPRSIVAIAQEICHELSDLMQGLGYVSDTLKNIINKLLTKFETERRRLSRLLKAIEKYIQQHPTSEVISEEALKELKDEYNKLVDIIHRLSSEFFKVAREIRHQDIMESLIELRRKLVDICKRFLTEEELAIYETVCELIEQEIRDFLHLVNEILPRVGLEKVQVVECLIRLNSKGIIGLEVRL